MEKVIHEVSLKTNASPSAIWELWENVQDWPAWYSDLEWVTINGDFKTGQIGQLKPKKAPVSNFKITTCIPQKQFIDVAKLPFSELIFDHAIDVINKETIVTHKISIKGPFSWLFKQIIGRKLKKGLNKAIVQLIEIAEIHDKKDTT